MTAPSDASLPPFFDLSDGMQVKVSAVDATTGATVAGVVISSVSLSVDPVGAEEPVPDTPNTGPFAFGDIAA